MTATRETKMIRSCTECIFAMKLMPELKTNNLRMWSVLVFFFQAEDGIRDYKVTGVQTCALPICALLDIGVGTGLSIAPYVDSPRFARIVGLDPSAAMLDRCRRKYPRVELHHGTQIGRASCRERV